MIFKIILLGVIQGLTEFLPVSSTAHLVLAEKLLGVSEASFGLEFDIALHLGTSLALILFFWRTWISLLACFFKKNEQEKENQKLAINLIIATIPAILMGIFLEKHLKVIFRAPFWIAVFLILFSLVFFIAEKISKKNKGLKDTSLLDSLFIGLNQALALLPGVSRSGITISAGLLADLKPEEAGRFAFLLSTPIILGAFLKEHYQLFLDGKLGTLLNWYSIIGIMISFIVGILTLKLFLNYLSKRGLMPFIIYRVILGLVVLLLINRF